MQSSAIELAEAIGLPLTHFVTINFSLTDIAPERAVEIFQLLRLRQFNKWARRPAINCDKPFIPAYVHFFENERDDHPFLEIGPGLPHNVHVHWPAHIPGDRLEDFQHRLWEWLDNGPGRYGRKTSISKASPRIPAPANTATWAPHFGAGHAGQGLIIGRRSGTRLNLDLTARPRLRKPFAPRP